MKTISFLILLYIVPCLAVAEQNALQYLYEPILGEQQQLMARRINLHARNAQFDAATQLSQTLLDSAEPLRDSAPSTYGQLMINHGILRVAASEYQPGLSIIERGMAFLEARTNPFNEILVNGVMAKGICQLQLGMLTDAEDTFRRGQHITHRQRGVYNEEQLPIVSYLTATNLRQRNPLAADQQQQFSLRVAEQSYGTNAIELLPTLGRLGRYFSARGSTIPLPAGQELKAERDLLLKNAVNIYLRAIEIIEINYGVNDLRLIPALRGLASTYVLQITNRKSAKFALLRSLEIVNSNPNSDLTDRAQAMVDLGDLYIITSDKKATETYLSAWTILQETPQTQQLAASLFDSPVRLHPKTSPVLYLDRTPGAAILGDELFVDLQYDVSPEGRARKIEVIGKNVPNEQVRLLRLTLRASKYRPRISNGEVVATEGLLIHQKFVSLNNKPLPEEKQKADTPKEDAPKEDGSMEDGSLEDGSIDEGLTEDISTETPPKEEPPLKEPNEV